MFDIPVPQTEVGQDTYLYFVQCKTGSHEPTAVGLRLEHENQNEVGQNGSQEPTVEQPQSVPEKPNGDPNPAVVEPPVVSDTPNNAALLPPPPAATPPALGGSGASLPTPSGQPEGESKEQQRARKKAAKARGMDFKKKASERLFRLLFDNENWRDNDFFMEFLNSIQKDAIWMGKIGEVHGFICHLLVSSQMAKSKWEEWKSVVPEAPRDDDGIELWDAAHPEAGYKAWRDIVTEHARTGKWDGTRLCPSPKVLVAPVAQGSISIIKVTWSQKQIIWLSEQYDVTKGLVTVETPLVSQHVGSAGWFHQVNLEHCAAGKDNTATQVFRSVKSLGIHVGMSKLVAVDMIQYRTIYGTGKKECKVKQCISQMLAYFTTCWGKRELNVEITKSVKGILKALDKQNFQNMPLLFRLGRMIKANIKEYG